MERNVISGNVFEGLSIISSQSNKAQGNYIGTDRTGADSFTDDMGNDGEGVFVGISLFNTIGGSGAGQGNVISNNDLGGVHVARSSGDSVLGNRIGTTGRKDLGNGSSDVELQDTFRAAVGDGAAGGSNTIVFNRLDGVLVFDGIANNTTANRLSANSTFSNGRLGITLSACEPNDTGDVDGGPNGCQNSPVITSAKTSSTATTIKGKLGRANNTGFRVEFFSNPAGGDEGKKFIGSKSITTDPAGNATFTFKPQKRVAAGQTITATVTRITVPDETSGFSAPKKAVKS